MNKRFDKRAYLFILPHMILFLVFFLIPLIYGIYVSFCKWDFVSEPVFVGLSNYKSFLFDKENYYYAKFWPALRNSILYVVYSVPILVIGPLIIAAGICQARRSVRSVLQSLFYFPYLLSVATVMITWRWLLDRSMGVINQLLGANIGWTTDEPWFWIAIVVLSAWWGLGGNLVIFIAGISSIPKDMYDAAAIDGAGRIKSFFYITLPGLKNQLLYAVVMTTIASFNIYGQPVMLATATNLPNDKNVLMALVQTTAWGSVSNAGMASAMALMLGLVIFIVSIFQFKISNRSGM